MSNANRVTISIHSLVKRETSLSIAAQKIAFNFNPLPRKEGDSLQPLERLEMLPFQSTPS